MNKKTLEKAICIYSKEAQKIMLFEEMAELQKEVCKSFRGAENELNIIDEMADVYIMLEQMKIIYGIDDIILELTIRNKLQRLEERLEREKSNGKSKVSKMQE